MGRERLFGWLESEHLTVFRRNLSRTSALRIAAREARTKCTGFFFLIAQLGRKAERHGGNGRRTALGASREERAAEAEATKVLSRSSASFPTFGTRRGEEKGRETDFSFHVQLCEIHPLLATLAACYRCYVAEVRGRKKNENTWRYW